MATLNLSANGSSISKSYQSVVAASIPSSNAARSPTYGQWAIFAVSAPLNNAFQQDAGGKESVLKVQSTGEGELVDLIEDLSDGRVQFAFVKVKDPNTTLPKSVLIGWCGEGVPERTKGYFTSHLAAVSKVLHGYHVQVTARSDRDLSPDTIIQKVSDASGSRYSGGASTSAAAAPAAPVASKPAFTPTHNSRSGAKFNPLTGSKTSSRQIGDNNVDEDGWGQDAPPVTRTQLEKVQSSYQPTKVDMRELSAQKQETSRLKNTHTEHNGTGQGDVVKGGYQPVGKVDIGALRRQAQEKTDDRPTTVRGSYEPVGKVDIAAIRARARQPSEEPTSAPNRLSPASTTTSARDHDQREVPPSFPDRTTSSTASERITSLPKPKVANRFGSGGSAFAGTKAPTPGGFGLESKATSTAPPIGVGRTFADEGGKTPAQIWAEKKARDRALSGADETPHGAAGAASPITNQSSGDWKSGYGGKSWAPVQTSRTGQSASSLSREHTGQEDEPQGVAPTSPTAGVGNLRDRFKGAPPMGAAPVGTGNSAPSPPSLEVSSKPNAGRGIPIPGLPSQTEPRDSEQVATRLPTPPMQPPRSPTPPTPPAMDSGSPIRVAMPVARGHNDQEVENAREEQLTPPPSMPIRSLAQVIPHEDDLTEESAGHDPARGAGEAAATTTFGEEAAESAHSGAHESGKRALVQYDYEKAEENELELKEGEYVTNIEMVDDDWWMGQNPRGESGLFPSNYVELVEGDSDEVGVQSPHQPTDQLQAESDHHHPSGTGISSSATATALYDYEAAEENELSFPENATITGVEFPDEDWWSGEYNGRQGLFPANYVQLNE